MWLFLPNGFLSIVQHKDIPGVLLCRARVKGVEHYFPDAEVVETPDADYLYRTNLPRIEVADRIREAVIDIRSGFKSSVTDRRRIPAYLDVWSTMAELQDQLADRPRLASVMR
jgi:hypothetical protein